MGPEAGVRSGALALIYRTFLKPFRFLGLVGDATEEHKSLREYTGGAAESCVAHIVSGRFGPETQLEHARAGVFSEALVLFYCISRKTQKARGF